jgi:hypothetical protein
MARFWPFGSRKEKLSAALEVQKKFSSAPSGENQLGSASRAEEIDQGLLIEGLFTQLADGESWAAWVLGRAGNPDLIPRLKQFAKYQSPLLRAAVRDALARLGDKQALTEIVAELESNELARRNDALETLAYAGSRSTVSRIAQLLGDMRQGNVESDSDSVYEPPSGHIAAWALSQIIEEPPLREEVAFITDEDIEVWKAWWSAHSAEYP